MDVGETGGVFGGHSVRQMGKSPQDFYRWPTRGGRYTHPPGLTDILSESKPPQTSTASLFGKFGNQTEKVVPSSTTL